MAEDIEVLLISREEVRLTVWFNKQNMNLGILIYFLLRFDVTGMDGFGEHGEFLSIVSTLLMLLLNAHNILALTSIPIETPIWDEFHLDNEEGVRHLENIQYVSLAALHSLQIWNAHFLKLLMRSSSTLHNLKPIT